MPQVSSRNKYETRDVAPVLIGATGFLLILLVWVLLACLGNWFRRLKHAEHPSTGISSSVLARRELPPDPRIQEDPRVDLEAYLAREHALLNTYGWINRRSGIVRIPISRAMEILSREQR